MSMILKKVWIDVIFVLAIISLLFAGTRGFKNFFPFTFGLAFLYLILMIARILIRKKTS